MFRAMSTRKIHGGYEKLGDEEAILKRVSNVPASVYGNSRNPIHQEVTVGLALISHNYGAFFELTGAGITDLVTFKSAKSDSSIDLSSQKWTYQVGLKGEDTSLATENSSEWVSKSSLPTKQPLIW